MDGEVELVDPSWPAKAAKAGHPRLCSKEVLPIENIADALPILP
jgi:hypothetical protein